jgi:hypothetical protein
MERSSSFLIRHKAAAEIVLALFIAAVAVGLFVGGLFVYFNANGGVDGQNINRFYVGTSLFEDDEEGKSFTFDFSPDDEEAKRIVNVKNSGDEKVFVTIKVTSLGNLPLKFLIADTDSSLSASQNYETFELANESDKDYYIFVLWQTDGQGNKINEPAYSYETDHITVTVTLSKPASD